MPVFNRKIGFATEKKIAIESQELTAFEGFIPT